MKKNPSVFQFKIQEPCRQPLAEMHPLPGGRHCEKCEKTVIDFTGMSDGQIIRLYQKHQGRICGVFRTDQLNRNMQLPLPATKGRNWKAVAAFATALTFSNVALTQTHSASESLSKEELFMKGRQLNTEESLQSIKGKVIDENGEPLIGASIVWGPGKGTASDIDGSFLLKIPLRTTSQKLTITYTGYKDQVVNWVKGTNEELEVIMKEHTELLPVATVTGYGVLFEKGVLTGMVATIKSDLVPESLDPENQDAVDKTGIYVPAIEVFPNPFISNLSVKIKLERPDAILFHLYSETGQLLFAESRELPEGTQTLQLNLNRHNLTAGVYFLRISDSQGEIRTRKLVKMSS